MKVINIKRLNDSNLPIPNRGSEFSAGLDLRSDGAISYLEPHQQILVPTGFAFEIPAGYVGFIKPRSGLAYKHGIDILAGVIDSDYRGEVKVILINHGRNTFKINHGDRIAQLVILPIYNCCLAEVDDLAEAGRGDGGFGSTGVK